MGFGECRIVSRHLGGDFLLLVLYRCQRLFLLIDNLFRKNMLVFRKLSLQHGRIYASLCNLVDLLLFGTDVLCKFCHACLICGFCLTRDLALHCLKEPCCLCLRLIELLDCFLCCLVVFADGFSERRAAREFRNGDVSSHLSKICFDAVFFSNTCAAVRTDVTALSVGYDNVLISQYNGGVSCLRHVAVARRMPCAFPFCLFDHVGDISVLKGNARRCERVQNELSAIRCKPASIIAKST